MSWIIVAAAAVALAVLTAVWVLFFRHMFRHLDEVERQCLEIAKHHQEASERIRRGARRTDGRIV